MVPLAQLIEQNQELCEQLHRFSRITAARLVATLGVLPEYHANTIRIEVLTHLAVIACSKGAEPKRDDLAKWFRFLRRENWISRQEDPVEDVFIGPVNTSFGTFRLFTGNFADGYFIAERLITFLANGASFPTFQETLDVALALLKLSDALADRLNLKRNTPGGGQSAENITVPRWRSLERPCSALFFSEEELHRLAISHELLSHFFFTDEDLQRLPSERLWNSSLERHSLFQVDGGVLVAEPSTLARTVARWILERINLTGMGGWADTFFHRENASLFVNDVANDLGIHALRVDLPPPPENTPLLMPFVGSFDVGKPVVLLTYAAPLAAGVEDFDGFDELSQPEQEALDAYLRSLADALENLPNFSGGLILVAIVTVGRGFFFGIAEWSERWHVHTAPLHDWLVLAADPDCSALRLWKLEEHVARARDRYHTELLNPSGLIALWSFWKKSDFWLLPKDFDIRNPHNLLVIGTDFGVDPRLEAKLSHDIHSVLSHDGTTWITVQRLNPRSLFPGESKSRIYADRIAARHQSLVGYVETESLTWWVIAPQIQAAPAHRDVLFQLWECVLQWIDRATDVIAKELSPTPQSIEIKIDLPDFARWQLKQRRRDDRPVVTPTVEVYPSKSSFTIVLYESFLAEFNQPKNVAERAIVRAVIDDVERLLHATWTGDKRDALVMEIVGSEHARYFHILETKMLEHLSSRSLRAQPLFISDEDLATAQIGLAELVDATRLGTVITGKHECREFLEKVVETLWERIESHLRPFSREAIAIACFEAIDEINRDSEHWKITTRAVLALNEAEEGAKHVLTTRRSQRSIASIGNRILIETAQYSASGVERTPLSRVDHSQLLANVELLITVANHRDAIAYGFLEPSVQINPRGDIEVDQRFYENVMRRYFSHRSDRLTDSAARSYDTYFTSGNTPASVPSETEVEKFDEAFQAEFGFTVSQLVRVSELWARFAVESQRLAQGDERRKDSLGKHVTRGAWLDKNRAGVQKITGIPAAAISFRPLLATSELMPMQFFEEMNFPTNQVVSEDELPTYLRSS
jgi:hypothetical protein